MTLAEFIALPFALVCATGTFTLGAGLIGVAGVIITARTNLKTKRLELAYARKADAYQDFIVSVSQYPMALLNHPADSAERKEAVLGFARASSKVALVASNKLSKALAEETEFNFAMGFMAKAPNDLDAEEKSYKDLLATIGQTMQRIEPLMRADLNRLGGL